MNKVLSEEEIKALFSAMSSNDWSLEDQPANHGLKADPPLTKTARDRSKSESWNIDLLLDVELPVSVSFGNSEMQLKDILKLEPGSLIELNKSVNDPVTIFVNRKPIAKGEIVLIDGNYGVRILEVESTTDRVRSLG